MMQQMMQMQQSLASSSASSEPQKPKKEIDPDMDSDVQAICEYFNIEERWMKKLNEVMKNRPDKEGDLEKITECLDRARSPTGLLSVKIAEIEAGTFVGKMKPSPAV